MPSKAQRYNAVAIALHWLIAAAILLNLGLGWWMGDALKNDQASATAAFQLHKSIGLSILFLSLLRLAWRLWQPPPPLAAPRWEKVLAASTHWLFYGLMIALPFSGWLYVSAQWRGDAAFTIPTLWFGWFEVQHIFGLSEGSDALRRQAAGIAITFHEYLSWSLVLLLLLHIGAALWHQFGRRDGVLGRMLPGVAAPPASERHTSTAINKVAALLVLLFGAVLVYYALPAAAPAAPVSDVEAALRDEVSASDIPAWRVESGEIRFSGVHAGLPFKGRFGNWLSAVHFDPDNLAQSQIVTVIETASATDGVPMHDKTLPQQEWFDSANYPFAVYKSSAIHRLSDDRYAIEGTLTIKTHTVNVSALMLTVSGEQLTIEGAAKIDRAAVDMGMESDPEAEYVSEFIGVAVRLGASKQ